jgi:hypothetical protein
MSLLHHHDDDKEFFSCWAAAYDGVMPAPPLLAPLLLHVALVLPAGAGLPPLALATALAEAAAIWAPYGVAVDAAGHCAATAPGTEVLRVEIVTAPSTRGAADRPPLGAIVFDGGGAAAPAITVLLGDIDRFVSTAHVLGFDRTLWPPLLRERALGRATGRVIAHEIGHYLLQTTQHDAAGLMRAMHSADDFVEPTRAGFALSKAAAARFARLRAQARLEDEGKQQGPADAGPSNQTVVKREPR